MGSILNDTKKVLGYDPSYTVFDQDIILFINSALATLNQLGVGPAGGYAIEDATPTWEALIGTDMRQNSVKSYVYFSVRMAHDPPTTSYLITAMKEQKTELESRLMMLRDETLWVDPSSDDDDVPDIIDGGDA